MRATPKTIWRVPAFLPYVQPPLTDAMVAAAEKKIGHPLPKEYLDLLREQNGGYIRYELPNRLNETISGIGPGYPSLISVQWDDAQEAVSFPLKGLYPFDGDGHWNLCLDYRKNPKQPTITYADVEVDSQKHVADSFADYLSLLRFKVDEREYVVEGEPDIEAIKSMLTTSLKVKFNPVDTYGQGYPVHCARSGDGWINLSPNTVPRGFVRTDDARYEQLKNLLPGEAQRFPQAPADSHILLTMGNRVPKLLAALANSGLRVRPLREYIS